MLIVIAIMLLLVAAAATIMPAATEARRVREAGRGLNVYLGSARNRAMESGRSCGVTFHFLGGTLSAAPCAMNLDQCEVPPDYEGLTEVSMALVNTSMMTVNLVSGTDSTGKPAPEMLPSNMVRPNDLIQFNRQGVIYYISAPFKDKNGNAVPPDNNGFLTNKVTSFGIFACDPNPAPPLPTFSSAVPFCIFRSPMKSGATPLQLPTASVVDFRYAGTGSGYMGAPWTGAAMQVYNPGQTVLYNGMLYLCIQKTMGQTPTNTTYWQPLTTFTVLFSSTGAIDKVYYNAYQSPVTDPIYLMIGKRDRVTNGFVASNGNESTLTNLQDLKNLWVAINPQTGLVNTAAVASSAAASNEANAVAPARQFAAQGIGIGGK
jgi:type II secretory pathway pseudopilin PulG